MNTCNDAFWLSTTTHQCSAEFSIIHLLHQTRRLCLRLTWWVGCGMTRPRPSRPHATPDLERETKWRILRSKKLMRDHRQESVVLWTWWKGYCRMCQPSMSFIAVEENICTSKNVVYMARRTFSYMYPFILSQRIPLKGVWDTYCERHRAAGRGSTREGPQKNWCSKGMLDTVRIAYLCCWSLTIKYLNSLAPALALISCRDLERREMYNGIW